MEKSEQKKLASKLIVAANAISGRRELADFIIIKGTEYMPPGYVGSEYRNEARKKIMFVREWVFCYRKQKVNVDVFKPNEAIASRYSVKQVDNRFYGVLNIEIKKSE